MGARAELKQALSEWDDPQSVMRRITRGVLRLIAAAEGATLQLVDVEGHLAVACGEGLAAQAARVGLSTGRSLSGLALSCRTAQRCDDTELDPRVDRLACRRVGARSLACVPLLHGAAPLGVLSVMSAAPGAFGEEVVEILAELAAFIGILVGTLVRRSDPAGRPAAGATTDGSRPRGPSTSLVASPDPSRADRMAAFISEVVNPKLADRAAARARIERVLEQRSLHVVFQPIVNLARRTTVAVEALTRFPALPERTPDAWFAEAHTVDMGIDLELLAIEEALLTLRRLPPNVVLGVNASPMAIASPGLRRLLAAVEPRQVAVEITEHVAVDDYADLCDRITTLRGLGARISIDDAGAGYASLRHILALSPDYIKLDLALTRDIDTDPARRALASALVAFVSESGARLVAEGIETASELATVRELGIPFGQGFHLGRPVPFDQLGLPGARR